MSLELSVDATRPLIDQEIDIRVAGVDGTATLSATTEWGGRTWRSEVGVRAVDSEMSLRDIDPEDGSYDTADPMGLFWAARAVGESTAGVETARTVLELERGGEICRETVTRTTRGPGVTVEEVEFDGHDGRYYEPGDDGPHPGVLVIGNERREVEAALLASRGFAALTVRYGGASPPTDVFEVRLEPFISAIEWLLDRPTHHDGPIGTVGFSRGGELALLLGVQSPAVGATVAFSGSGISIGEPLARGRASPWVHRSDETYFLPCSVPPGWMSDMLRRWLHGEPVSLRSAYRTALDNHGSEHRSRATFPVEQIDGPVLLVSGGDDELWPAEELAEFAVGRLDGFDHRHRFEHVVYDDAGHQFRAPYLPTTGRATRAGPYPRLRFALGGDPTAQASADADAWSRALDYLRDGLLER